jgi:hypothetical protein
MDLFSVGYSIVTVTFVVEKLLFRNNPLRQPSFTRLATAGLQKGYTHLCNLFVTLA